MVARALVGVQQEVLAKHGYAGEQGFAQASPNPSPNPNPNPNPDRDPSANASPNANPVPHPTPNPDQANVCLMQHAADAVVSASVAPRDH